ncbi:kinesin-like protein KIF24 isoform X2 [Anolis carolinensis]|nr:PREDICTED: kinesin-like protein KIF24 isoform X2 [Anolis carolinensis]XP_008117377.1 PREDICTED: kinesin-like protein KIF24 isoform X2 [Anolis carolinensis]|eukprot:XP_003226423.1 PREDICTED: kinesin-like protein KIF24 isoform X2 [Anolis carolinensis]
MASCLYECLCEAELEKYYPHFTALGYQRIDELAKVSMKDYAKLGVHNMKDRKRLFQLIRIIRMLQAEEATAGRKQTGFQAGAVRLQPQVSRSGPRRQLHFDSLPDEGDGRKDLEPGPCALSSCFGSEDKEDLAAVLSSHQAEYKRPRKESSMWTEYKVGVPVISSSSDIAPLSGEIEAPFVQRIAHVSGYNYGVPHSCTRSVSSEKEAPWTETDKIRVCVRKRPLGLREERRGEVNIITVEDKDTLLLHEKKEAVDLTQYILQHAFYFDEVFGEACSNQDVYLKTAHPLVQHIFNGGNATCFAYGQTGAGKTYTMIGTHQNPGLYALAAKDIFRQLEKSHTRKDLHVWISFYEIYCGQLYDLLNGRKRLFAREDSKRVVQIVGLREIQVSTVNLLLEVILKGGKERSTGATGVNSDSSRSHAIIQIQIKDPASRVFGRISFIDLAGSERAADARDSDRQTKMEGAEINQSLLALKECIRALDQEHAHTPFRQSKLTQVLKDSFVGNSKTCMIANVSPSHIATEHTLNTLRYADRVKELKRGMKCCTPLVNRRRATANVSPKRIQSSPCAQSGEKNSPKKVKLGLQHPTLSKSKASPGQFPFSSVPKGQARKGHLGTQDWHSCSTPRAGAPAKKAPEDPSLPFEKNPFGKDFVSRSAGVKCLKVQPVQKQLVSREDFSLGDTNRPSVAPAEEGGRLFMEQCKAAWAEPPPHQRDREQHLRLYHQQFQQPPILQQKLSYQPLERFLAQYKPQEVRVREEAPAPTPLSPPDCDETMQLEDLDDSDFSEDSFSPGPSTRKVEVQAKRECSQGSFFLHRREHEAEGQEVQAGQELFSKQPELEDQRREAWSGMEDSAICKEDCRNQSEWSTEASAALSSSLKNDTPEKPYCSQDDSVVCNSKSKETLLSPKKPRCSDLPLTCPDKCFSVVENAMQSPFAHLLASASPIADGLKEESLQGKHAPVSETGRKKYPHKGTDLDEALSCSGDFAGETAPLTVSLLDPDSPEGQSVQGQRKKQRQEQEAQWEKKPSQPRKRWDEDPRRFFGNQTSPPSIRQEMDHWRAAGPGASPPARSRWLSQSHLNLQKTSPAFGVESALNELESSVFHKYPSGATGLADLLSPGSERKGEEDPLLLSNLQFSDYVTSPQYDADTEAARTGSLACFILGEEDSTKPGAQVKHPDMVGKPFIPLPISDHAGSKKPSKEGIPLPSSLAFRKGDPDCSEEAFTLMFSSEEMALQSKEALGRQSVLQIHRKQLDEMANLCFREESLIRKMPELDFEDFVTKLDEILTLKSKCIQRMRTQLQPFLAATSSNEAALLPTSPT